jgi:hypothetical protein
MELKRLLVNAVVNGTGLALVVVGFGLMFADVRIKENK